MQSSRTGASCCLGWPASVCDHFQDLPYPLTVCNERCLTTPELRPLGRGQMGHALRVTEAGATPQKP